MATHEEATRAANAAVTGEAIVETVVARDRPAVGLVAVVVVEEDAATSDAMM